METINLPNRYRDHNWLEQESSGQWSGWWRLVFGNPNGMSRYLFDDSGITAVDPSGGPFMERGYEVEGHTIEEIQIADDKTFYLKLTKL